MKFRRDSSFPWKIASKVATVFGCRREAVRCLQNCSIRSLHEDTDRGAKLWYQAMAPFLSVVGKSLHLMAPLTMRKSRMA
ncbi:hypothetical protein A2U01_0078868, partial [Trifolium medium]|nr:hypothetical protein [Trifolium medium]